MKGRKLRWLNIIDEYARECLASVPRRSWRQTDIIELLSGLFIQRGCPRYIRSDNGSEFTAKAIRGWLERLEYEAAERYLERVMIGKYKKSQESDSHSIAFYLAMISSV